MTMRTSDAGLCDLLSHEGLVLCPYRDSKGIWTVFIGHTASAGPPDPATMPRGVARPLSEALEVFRRDLAKFEARVNRLIKVPLKQHEFDALVSFDFNTGGLEYRDKTGKLKHAMLRNHLNAGDRVAAANAFMGWAKPPEIIGRRRKEQALFRTGTYSSGGFATVYTADAAGRVQWSAGKRVSVMAVLSQAPQPDVPAPESQPQPMQPDNPGISERDQDLDIRPSPQPPGRAGPIAALVSLIGAAAAGVSKWLGWW